MEASRIPQPVVSTVLTLQDVLSAGGGTLTQEQFSVIANAAQSEAVKTKGGASDKWSVFWTKLDEYCTQFGDSIPRRFVSVALDSTSSSNLAEGLTGQRLFYYQVGTDKYRYLAAVYP